MDEKFAFHYKKSWFFLLAFLVKKVAFVALTNMAS